MAWLIVPATSHAVGRFISAPSRVDMVYDDARELLYITSGNQVLRYDINKDTYLPSFQLGGVLKGIDISDEGTTLAVADASITNGAGIYVIDLETSQSYKANYTLESTYAGGPPSVAFAGDGSILIATGAQWGNMHRYIPATNTMQTLFGSMRHQSMLVASADGSVVGFAEGDISDGKFGRYRTSDGDVLRRQGYQFGTSWFNYEMGVNFDGTQYAIPTYGGCLIYSSDLLKTGTIGTYAAGQPIGVVYSPVADVAYFPWATTSKVFVYDTETLTKTGEYDFEFVFPNTGNHPYTNGRMKTSMDGKYLFCTVGGGIRYYLISEPPVAQPQEVTLAEDTAVSITLSATDDNTPVLKYTVVGQPARGTLSGIAPQLSYTPAANFFGNDSFTFKANDGMQDGATTTVAIIVTPVPDTPVANNMNITTAEDTPVNIVLNGSDPDGDTITYQITSPPSQGTLLANGKNVTYSPTTDYSGPDSFRYKTNDGTLNSVEATVSITVLAVNDQPVAIPQSVEMDEDTTHSIILTGADAEGDLLTYTISSPPTHGILTGTPPEVMYTPAADYFGPDSFAFTVSDSVKVSDPVAVTISVNPVNDAPVAQDQSLTLEEDTTVALHLVAYDIEDDPLIYIVSSPKFGSLSGTAPDLVYTPAQNFNGTDSFHYYVNDGNADSLEAEIVIEITPDNDTPVAEIQHLTCIQNKSLSFKLNGEDEEGDPLTYLLTSVPHNGSITGTLPYLVYTPAKKFTGFETLEYRVEDGTASTTSTVHIVVLPKNKALVAFSKNVVTSRENPVTIRFEGWSASPDLMQYVVQKLPKNGTLTGVMPNLVYTPAPGFTGSDKLKFRVQDSTGKSKSATVRIIVGP